MAGLRFFLSCLFVATVSSIPMGYQPARFLEGRPSNQQERPTEILGTVTSLDGSIVKYPGEGTTVSGWINGSDGTSGPNHPSKGSILEAMEFMQKFGYIPKGSEEADFIFNSDVVTKAIRNVQRFGAIPETGVLDDATIQLMQRPRCGVPDLIPEDQHRRKKRYIVGGDGWNKRELTYFVANWSPKLINKENVQMELRRAFDAWSGYSNLNFTEIQTQDADIIIFFAEYSHFDGYPFDGQGGILAHAYYPYEFGSYGGDVHFDESEQWTINPKDEYSGLDFFTVAVHEIGHSLGLAHSPVSGSIMFPYYKGHSSYFALDYDDIMAMWELYIKRRLEGDNEYYRRKSHSSTTSTPVTTPTTTPATSTTSVPYTPANDGTQNDAAATPEEDTTDNGVMDGENGDKKNGADYGDEGDDDVRYHGDYETVDDHIKRVEGTQNDLPGLPNIPQSGEDTEDKSSDDYDYYEIYKKRMEEEQRKREEERLKREEEQRKQWEEEVRRRKEEEREREEERQRKEEEKIRQREEDTKRREEEVRRRDEEERRRWEEERKKWEEEEREERRRIGDNDTGIDEAEKSSTNGSIPNVCKGNFDAVGVLRGELFFFQGKYLWRYQERGILRSGYPTKIQNMFPGLPSWIKKINAVYERRNDSNIIFFVGKYFYVHDGNKLVEGSPFLLVNYGLPEALTKLDAVFYWPKTQKVYLFRRNLYWRFDEESDSMDDRYPSNIERWNGVPEDIDAVITYADGTYFFKGDLFWRYNDHLISPDRGYPLVVSSYWNNC